MVDLRKRRVGLEDALVMFEAESKPILKEAAQHRRFTPDRQKRRPAMYKKSKTKGRRR